MNNKFFMKIYYTSVEDKATEEEYENMLTLVDNEKRERIKKFKFENDRLRSLYGEIMARSLAVQELHIANDKLVKKINEHGRPYFDNVENWHYSISHSGKYVACAVSNFNLGVDIEHKNGYKEKISKRFFAKDEIESLSLCDESNREKLFYTFWTIKESYVKYLGVGLVKELSSFSVKKDESGFYIVDEGQRVDKKIFVKEIDNYILAAVYDSQIDDVWLDYRDYRNFIIN